MSYIKYDSDLSVNVKNDINDLKDKINSCFTSISTNADNSKIDLDDPRVVVIEDVIKDNTFFQKLIGNPITVVKEETKNYSANASLYNDAAVQLSTKASEFKEEICVEINKVVLALEGINNKITEYEVSPLLELESFNVDYNESAYSFLYGYASVGGAIPGDEDDNTIVPPEVPIDDGKAKNFEEAPAKTGTHTGTDGSANNGKDGSTNTGGHKGNDGSANNGKDGSTNTGGHTGSDGSANNSKDGSTNTGGHTGNNGSVNNGEDGSTNTGGHKGNDGSVNNGKDGSTNTGGHTGSDGSANNGEDGSTNTGGHTGNNGSANNGEDGSTNTGGHNGNNGSANNGEDGSTNTGGHNGNNGNNDADDDELIAALMAAAGSNGDGNTGNNSDSSVSGHNGNNGSSTGNSDDKNKFGSYGNGDYIDIPKTGLFSGSIFGNIISSSYIDKKDDEDVNSKNKDLREKYSWIYNLINSILPLFAVLGVLGSIFGIISTTVLGVLGSVLTVFGYFYLERLFNFWVTNGYFGSNGKSHDKNTNRTDVKSRKRNKFGVKSTIAVIITAIVDFVLVLLKILSSYWFILLLLLLLLIIWFIIVDEDKESFYNNVWFVLISTVFCLMLTMVLVITNIISEYWIFLDVVIALLCIWYVIKILKVSKNNKKEIL